MTADLKKSNTSGTFMRQGDWPSANYDCLYEWKDIPFGAHPVNTNFVGVQYNEPVDISGYYGNWIINADVRYGNPWVTIFKRQSGQQAYFDFELPSHKLDMTSRLRYRMGYVITVEFYERG